MWYTFMRIVLLKAGMKASNSVPICMPCSWSSRTLKVPHRSSIIDMVMMGLPVPTSSPVLGYMLLTSPSICAVCTVSPM